MIVPDVNLLIYAYDAESPWQTSAASWLEASLSGNEPFGMPWLVALAFIRISTHSRIMQQPMSVDEAMEIVASWERRPCFLYLTPSPDHRRNLQELLTRSHVSGNRINDGHIAALALEQGGVVHTTDGDFERFPGVKWKNPLKPKNGKR